MRSLNYIKPGGVADPVIFLQDPDPDRWIRFENSDPDLMKISLFNLKQMTCKRVARISSVNECINTGLSGIWYAL